MLCFQCDQPAVQECARCGALYCDDHGDALCERCMDPISALPSYRIYRGSLAALLIGSVFAIWLLVRPGASGDLDGPPAALAAVLPSATTAPAPATPARTPTPGAPAAGAATPAGAAAPSKPAAATPAPTPTPTSGPALGANRTYTVKSGDTLYGIADTYRGSTDLGTFVERIYQLNGLAEGSVLGLGVTIRIP